METAETCSRALSAQEFSCFGDLTFLFFLKENTKIGVLTILTAVLFMFVGKYGPFLNLRSSL